MDAWEERRNNSREHFINTLPSFYGNKETVNLAIDFFLKLFKMSSNDLKTQNDNPLTPILKDAIYLKVQAVY